MSEENINDVTVEKEEQPEDTTVLEVNEAVVVETPVAVEEVVAEVLETATISEAKEEDSNGVISSATSGSDLTPALTGVSDGVIGSGAVARKAPKKPVKISKTEEPEKVALFSTRNVTWSEVGKVYRGYNIVTKQAAERWLTRDHVRLATPEEVAREFGN